MALWIKVDREIESNPKIIRFARALKVTKREAIGHLIAIWCYVSKRENGGILLDNAEDVDLLPDIINYSGEPETLLNALLNCGKNKAGLIELTEDGKYKIHDWESWSGSYEDTKQKDRIRKQANKAKKEAIVKPEVRYTGDSPKSIGEIMKRIADNNADKKICGLGYWEYFTRYNELVERAKNDAYELTEEDYRLIYADETLSAEEQQKTLNKFWLAVNGKTAI